MTRKNNVKNFGASDEGLSWKEKQVVDMPTEKERKSGFTNFQGTSVQKKYKRKKR